MLVICIGILWALLLPSVYTRGNESRRRAQCLNNLKNLSIATANFEGTKRQYPGYQSLFGTDSTRKAKIGTWVVSLMPYLPWETSQQQSSRDQWDDPSTYDAWLSVINDGDKNAIESFYPQMNLLHCPSDIMQTSEFAGTSYAANTGFYLLPNDPALGLDAYSQVQDTSERSVISQRAANGLFANHLGPDVVDPLSGQLTKVFGYCTNKTRSSDVQDGISNTILFAEHISNLNWRDYSITDDSSRWQLGIVWLYAGNSASQGRPTPLEVTNQMRINDNKLFPTPSGPLRARPSSFHPGVVPVAFADGSTRGIHDRIDYHVYQSLMTPHDAASDIPNPEYKLRRSDYLR